MKFDGPSCFSLSPSIISESHSFEKMASAYGESLTKPPQSPSFSSSSGGSNESGNFECNICFDLAQDPIVTLCGHLFCWPCLYKWLHIHSHSQECPVCKALIEEEKLVPLYGRGKNSTDPRSKSIPGVNIPNRPAGQRPETAPPRDTNTNHFAQPAFGFMGGLAPMATARFGSFTFAAAFGGILPTLLNFQFHGMPNVAMYGGTGGFPYGISHPVHGGNGNRAQRHWTREEEADQNLKKLLLVVFVVVLVTLCIGFT